MSRGLGKIERWILIAAYQKDAGKIPDGWLQLDGKQRQPTKRTLKKRCLYRSEIMLNYFGLELSPLKDILDWHTFKVTSKSKSAVASCRRATKSLLDKGYIEMWTFWYDKTEAVKVDMLFTYLSITKEGKIKAKELNVNSGQKNPLLTLKAK